LQLTFVILISKIYLYIVLRCGCRDSHSTWHQTTARLTWQALQTAVERRVSDTVHNMQPNLISISNDALLSCVHCAWL